MSEETATIKEQALSKMLLEMSQSHDETVDEVHNFLCEQGDDELFAGILMEGKSIQDALNYLVAEAKKNRRFRITDSEGYKIIKQYFLSTATKVASVGRVSSRPVQEPHAERETPVVKEPKPIVKKKVDTSLNLSIFDFMEDPEVPEDEEEVEDDELSDSDD